jgi:methyl-accepting chemotaxis protein
MWSNLAIRHKLSLVIGGALLLSLIISTLISDNAMRDMVVGRIEIQEVPATLSSVANAIEKEINIPLAISRAMSQNIFTNNWLKDGEPTEQTPEMIEYLKVMQKENNAITSFIVSGNTKNYYTADGISRQINPTTDSWFYEFI